MPVSRKLCIEAFYQWIFIGIDFFDIKFYGKEIIPFSLYCFCEDNAVYRYANKLEQGQQVFVQYVSSTSCYFLCYFFIF